MKIGISTLAFYPKPFGEIFAHLEKIGIKNCEIINEHPYELVDNDIMDSYNIKISLHAPISDINIASHNKTMRDASISQIKKSIEIASNIDSEIVVVHPGYIPILGQRFKQKIVENNLNSLGECSRYAKDCGVTLCIENMPDINGVLCKNLNELEKISRDIGAGIALDVGHANTMGIAADDMLKFDRIKHIHLSDNDGSYDNHNALGSGNIDFELLFENLKKRKYSDLLIIEVKNQHEISESLGYLKNRKIDKT